VEVKSNTAAQTVDANLALEEVDIQSSIAFNVSMWFCAAVR
jgi:hypothetical protein